MRHAYLLAGLAALWLAGAGAPAQEREGEAEGAGAGSPVARVEQTTAAVIEVLGTPGLEEGERRERVIALLREAFHLPAMSRRLLGRHWQEATREQRALFVSRFAHLLGLRYWEKIRGYANHAITVLDHRIRDERVATVNTLIRGENVAVPVDYKLFLHEDEWYGYDVLVERLSLVRKFRQDFLGILNKEGIDGVIAALERRIEDAQ